MNARIDKLSQISESGLYPIRTVTALTGVNPVTLRAWERRYHLITPARTPKGHRLYTREDIDHIRQITTLLGQGIAISQVKPLLLQGNTFQPARSGWDTADSWDSYQHLMMDAIRHFDEHRLDNIYNDALSLYPVDLVSSRLITPLLEMLGRQWKERDTGIAEEHFFSVYLRNKLGARIQHMNLQANGARLLIACLPGEQHETGMLLFALAAIHRGYRTLILGANLPLQQIPAVLQQRSCDAIVLSGFSRPARNLFQEQLPGLLALVSVPVFVGGSLAERHHENIEAAGALSAGADIHDGIEMISNTLNA